MVAQLALDSALEAEREPTTAQQYEQWIGENPHVYIEVVRLAREWKRRGFTHGSIGHIWEVLRWELGLKTGEAPELNNNWRAWVARDVMTHEPDLDGFFRVRESEADAMR